MVNAILTVPFFAMDKLNFKFIKNIESAFFSHLQTRRKNTQKRAYLTNDKDTAIHYSCF